VAQKFKIRDGIYVPSIALRLGFFYALTEASVYGGVSTPCIHCNGVCKSLIRTFAAGSGTPFFLCPKCKNTYQIMSNLKEKRGLLPVTVMEGVTVNVVPDERFEFLLSTRDVAAGYGVTRYAIRQVQCRYGEEFVRGKHFVTGCDILSHLHAKGVSTPITSIRQPNQVYWTKAGIIRLGFFIKSARAKLFRDWAEELVIRLDEQRDLFGVETRAVAALPVKAKRNYNRLTADRMVRILADVARIEDGELRMRLVNELMGRAE
jgi:hypothetical protein